MFVNLVPRDQRPPVGEVIQRLRRAVSQLPGINVFMQPVQNLRIGGRSSKALYQYTMQGIEPGELYGAADRMMAAMAASPLMQDVTSDLQLSAPQARLDIDRAKAAELGVPVDRIRLTLYSAFGSRQVSTIYTPTNDYQVILEVDPAMQGSIEDLKGLYVSGAGGRLVPVEAFASIVQSTGPLSVNHLSQLPAVTLSFNLAPGHSLGEAVDAIHALEARQNLPPTISTSFAGTAKVFQEAGANQLLMLLAAVLVIYTVLGVLYESLIHPITVISTLPSAGVGAALALLLFKMEFSIIALIGVFLLLGIVKKNAILIIDFALDAERGRGLSAQEAVREACLLRFRPILMTTLAAGLGALPLAIGFGEGSELRRPLGVAIIGGLIASQLLTLLTTPVVYIYLDRLRGRGRDERRFARRRSGPPSREAQPT
jgi:HAE1 family hydrophobic/amphiphilic exporter-1